MVAEEGALVLILCLAGPPLKFDPYGLSFGFGL